MDSPRPDISRQSGAPAAEGNPSVAASSSPTADPSPHAPDYSLNRPQSPSQPAATPTWVLVARLSRPHGRRGELIADILTDFPERFHERTRLFLIPPERIGTPVREVALENFWFLRSRIVLKFQGIDSINDAESLRNFDVAIPAAQRAPLEDGSVYTSDLVGCRVYDLNRSGVEVGEIVDVDRGSSSIDLLVVRIPGARGGQADALIPFAQDYVVRMAVEERRIEMRLPEGLLAINAPLTEDEKRESRGE
jgi:16S rRNA processing protein RimM